MERKQACARQLFYRRIVQLPTVYSQIDRFNEEERRALLTYSSQEKISEVPGRKTDVKDAEWIAELVRHGLVKASYISSREQRELREMVRYRNEIVNERARELNRIQAVLEGANMKPGNAERIKQRNIKSLRLRARSRFGSDGPPDRHSPPNRSAARCPERTGRCAPVRCGKDTSKSKSTHSGAF